MNHLERVQAAIHFGEPDRVPIFTPGLGDVFPMPMLPPRSWQPGHTPEERGLFPYLGDDVIMKLRLWRWHRPAWAKAPQYKHWTRGPRQEVDEWGCIWERDAGYATLGHPGRAALPDWQNLDYYLAQHTPNVRDPARYALFLKLAKLVGRSRYRMAMFHQAGPFQTAMNVRGFNSFITDFRRHPGEMHRLLSHLTEFFVENEKVWITLGGHPHGFFMYDDFGTQDRPFIAPAMFREFFEPVYRRLADTAHSLHCDFHLHSCGNVGPLIPLLHEWGVDALEFDSPRMVGWDALAPHRGKMMFWGCVNIQTIYTQGTPAECVAEVAQMIKHMGTPRGGFGAYFYPSPSQIHVPKANIKAFARGLKEQGIYARHAPEWWEDIGTGTA